MLTKNKYLAIWILEEYTNVPSDVIRWVIFPLLDYDKMYENYALYGKTECWRHAPFFNPIPDPLSNTNYEKWMEYGKDYEKYIQYGIDYENYLVMIMGNRKLLHATLKYHFKYIGISVDILKDNTISDWHVDINQIIDDSFLLTQLLKQPLFVHSLVRHVYREDVYHYFRSDCCNNKYFDILKWHCAEYGMLGSCRDLYNILYMCNIGTLDDVKIMTNIYNNLDGEDFGKFIQYMYDIGICLRDMKKDLVKYVFKKYNVDTLKKYDNVFSNTFPAQTLFEICCHADDMHDSWVSMAQCLYFIDPDACYDTINYILNCKHYYGYDIKKWLSSLVI